MQGRRDDWLLANRERLSRESPTAIALSMQRAGLYSAKTTVGDIRVFLFRRCGNLRLPFRHDL
ncbi:MAG: hypothetical protein QOE70_1319 [Chthoniobacter sp.]|jgi:hypothetical protein|nr:hypothetical protein [Chthoniobacter sp.]